MKNQIETQEHWVTLRCCKILKETISEEAFQQILLCNEDTLSIYSNIYFSLRDDLDEERNESLSKK